jgi:hypothetical protein
MPLHLLATAASPGGSYSEAIEKHDIGLNSRPVPQMPSELDTCIREPPADNLPARPWHDNSTRSNTHRMAIESFLNPSPPAATPIFQDLLPIAKLLLPPECPPKTSSPNTTYKCIACYRIYRKRASLQYHIGTVHLPIYPVRHLSRL